VAAETPPETTTPAMEPGPTRRRVPVIPLVVLLAIVGGMVFLFMFRSRPEEQVRRLIDRQIKLAAGGRFGELWSTLSQRARSACPSGTYTSTLSLLPPDFWGLIEYRDIRISVDGNRAEVTYVIAYNGKPIERATAQNPDVYVRAEKTLYGRTISVEDQLERLDREVEQQLIAGPKQYEERKRAILERGATRPQLFIEGQWYDDLDAHVRCA
jgi:hypothetical protein